MYGQWKQRLYAFLIRRVVGPYLAEDSLRKLHESVEVSLQEGKFVFTDVNLNTDYLTLVLSKRGDARVGVSSVVKARIRKLQINLSLEEPKSQDNTQKQHRSSIAWKAVQLGRTSSSGTDDSSPSGVKLVAHVDIEGLDIEVEPDAKAATTAGGPSVESHTALESSSAASSPSSMLSSYIDAALSSLHLSLQMTDLQVRISTRSSEQERWLTLRVATAYYHDIDNRSHSHVEQKTKKTTTLYKAIDFAGIVLETGEDIESVADQSSDATSVSTSIIGKTEGTGQILFRVIEYPPEGPDQSSDVQCIHVQNDVEVSLSQKFNVLVDVDSLQRIFAIASAIALEIEEARRLKPEEQRGGATKRLEESNEQDDQEQDDVLLVTGIMKQYAEARHFAARNEIRGGVLIPRSPSEGDVDASSMAFDAFFDANDHSFHHYTTVLERSTLGSSRCGIHDTGFVHTRLKLHLLECGIKIEFPPKGVLMSLGGTSQTSDEYVLLRINDINASASSSRRSLDFSLALSNLIIEDSFRRRGPDAAVVEIGSILHFVQDDDAVLSTIVSDAPCLSMRVVFQSQGEHTPETAVDVSLEPVEVVLRPSTLSNLQQHFGTLRNGCATSEQAGADASETHQRRKLRVSVACQSASFQVPLVSESISGATRLAYDSSTSPFVRCGYAVHGVQLTRYPSMDIAFRPLSLSLLTNAESRPKESIAWPMSAELSSSEVLVGVVYPRLDSNGIAVSTCRMDIFSISGPAPVFLTYRRAVTDAQKADLGRLGFPAVPSISSFKARQEDDDDARGSRYFSTRDALSESVLDSPVRAADPQSVMLEAAMSCESLIEIAIPDLVGDITKDEAVALHGMLSGATTTDRNAATAAPSHTTEKSGMRPASLAIGIKIDQATLAVHTKALEGNSEGRWYSYKALLEGFRAYGVVALSRLTHIRVLGHEANLFEGCDLVGALHESKEIVLKTARDRGESIRKRTMSNDISVVRPIIFRSQLFIALSPESPSLLLDFLSLENLPRSSFDGNTAWKVHITLYNLTHRYDIESRWLERIGGLFRSGGSDGESSGIRDTKSKPSLIKLFVSLVDCNVDYTAPFMFDTSGRMIIRVGDFRLSSNLVVPSGPAQACKVSLGDVTIQICSTRYSHNQENALLTSAARVFSPRQLLVEKKTPARILQAMHLITMMTLDATDVELALIASGQDTRQHTRNSEPRITVSLTFGNMCIFGCKDSFACFTNLIGDWQLRVTSLHPDSVENLKLRNEAASDKRASLPQTDELSERQVLTSPPGSDPSGLALLAPAQVSEPCRSSHSIEREGPGISTGENEKFSLDGYDWTTVDHEWSKNGGLAAGDEQSAKWFASSDLGDNSSCEAEAGVDDVQIVSGHGDRSSGGLQEDKRLKGVRIISNHIQLQPVSDPLSQTDMGASKYARTPRDPPVQARVFVRDLRLRCRLFDGYDWPLAQHPYAQFQKKTNAHFVIEKDMKKHRVRNEEAQVKIADQMHEGSSTKQKKKTTQLLHELLEGDKAETVDNATFRDTPLPEERGKTLWEKEETRRLARRMNKFFQISLSGLKLRLDTFIESDDHRLASCLDMAVSDLFLAETISSDTPVKLLGEWFNEVEHPRLSTDGMIMMKMVTWHPMIRVRSDGRIASDESIARLHMLPLRVRLDQRALRFVQAFLATDIDEDSKKQWLRTLKLNEIPPPKFLWFKVKPCKMKVDYQPVKCDIDALRDGSYVELINLSPLVDMVIVLKEVVIADLVGFGAVLREMLGRWIEDICATQMYKFLTNATPFQPFTSVGGGAANMFVLPWQAYQEGGGIRRAFRSGAASFAETFAYETLNTTARLAGVTARTLSTRGPLTSPLLSANETTSPLPSRPQGTPRGVGDTAQHALESIARGIETANYRVVIVPYREYHRAGPGGAARSVMNGIPVAVMAPLGAASEAISYTLLGARNQLRPDIRKEDEASERGLHHEG